MKFITLLMLLLCMLLAATAMAGDPLDTNDGTHMQVAATAVQAYNHYTQPVQMVHPTLKEIYDHGTAAYTGDPIDGNDTPNLQVWVPNVGLIDLFWWLRK